MSARAVATVIVAAATLVVGAEAAGTPPEVAIPGRLYAPGELDVLAGQAVTWNNVDSKSHTVTSEDDLFDSGYLGSGASFSHTFGSTGTFAYFCRIHRAMRGVVRVYSLILTGPPRPLPPAWAVAFRGISPNPGETVVLERRSRGPFAQVAETTAAADGSFSFRQRPSAPAAFRARADAALSPVVRVAVKPSVTVTVSGVRARISTSPARPRSEVEFQVYDREHFGWFTVEEGRLDARSEATLAVPVGAARARVVVRGRDGWADGVSRTLVLSRD